MLEFVGSVIAVGAGFLAYQFYMFWRDIRAGKDPNNAH